MLDETEFYALAAAFISEICGHPIDGLSPDRNLLESGILDSLRTIEFLAFIEAQRGRPLPSETLSPAAAATLRGAYDLIAAP